MSLTTMLEQSLARLKPADRRALVFVSVFLGSVFGYVYLIEPVLIRYDAAQSELTELLDQQRRFSRQQRMLPRRELKLAEYRAQWADLNRRFELQTDSAEVAVSGAINELSYYARLAGVTVSGMRPLEAQNNGDYLEIALEVEASAGYDILHAFFYYIETSPSLLAITDLELSARPGESEVGARFKLANIARVQTDTGDAAVPPLLARRDRLQLVISRWTGYAPLVVAKHNGYLDAEDRHIDLLLADDKITIERLLVSGEVDGVGTSMPELLDYWAKGMPLKIVMPLGSSIGTEGLVVRADSEIRELADLRGQRVAVAPQGQLQFVLYNALRDTAMSFEDVRIDALGPSQVARQIVSGTLDVGLTREPLLSNLINNGQARLLYASHELPAREQSLLVDLLAVTPEVITEKTETLRLLLNGLLKARLFIAEQPSKALEIIADWEGQRPELTATNLAKLTLFDADQTRAFFAAGQLAEQLAYFETYRQDIRQPLPLITAEDLVAAEFLDQAAMAAPPSLSEPSGEH